MAWRTMLGWLMRIRILVECLRQRQAWKVKFLVCRERILNRRIWAALEVLLLRVWMAFRAGWETLTVGRLDMAKRLWIWLVWDMEPEVFRVWKG